MDEIYNLQGQLAFWQEELKQFPPFNTNDPNVEQNRFYAQNMVNSIGARIDQLRRQGRVPVYTSQQPPTSGVGFGGKTQYQYNMNNNYNNSGMFQAAAYNTQQYGGMNTGEQTTVGNTNGRYSNSNRARVPHYSSPTEQQIKEEKIQQQEQHKIQNQKQYSEDSQIPLVVPIGAEIIEVEDKNSIFDKVVNIPENSETDSVTMYNRIEKIENESKLIDLSTKHSKYDLIPTNLKREYIIKSESDFSDEIKNTITGYLNAYKEIASAHHFSTLSRNINSRLPNFSNFLNDILLEKLNDTLTYGLDLKIGLEDLVNDFSVLENNTEIFTAKHLIAKQPEYYINIIQDALCDIISNINFTMGENYITAVYEEPVIFLTNDLINDESYTRLCLRPDSFPKLFTCIAKAKEILGKDQTALGVRLISYDNKTCRYNKQFNVYDIKYGRSARYILSRVKQA